MGKQSLIKTLSKMTVLLFLVTTFLCVALVKFSQWLYERRIFLKKLETIPGPEPKLWVGNALDFKTCLDHLPTLLKYLKEYGSTYKLQLGPDHTVFTSDTKLIEIITTSNTQIKKSNTYTFLANWIGDGVVTSDNPKWKNHRRIITPTFHFNILKDFIPTFNKNAEILIEHWYKNLKKSPTNELDIYDDIHACALDVICETAMGISVNAVRDGERSDYMASVKEMGRNIMERSFSFWRQIDAIYRWSARYRTEVRMVAYMKNITYELIKRKRLERSQKPSEVNESLDDLYEGKKRKAFLDHLMDTIEQTGSAMTDEDLSDEVGTLIIAGHDTTASGVLFALYYLGMYPEIQEKVYNEVIEVLNGDDTITYEKLGQLKYMEMVIKETLRMSPSVPMYSRKLIEDLHFGEMIIPKGVNLSILAIATHKDENIYKNPEVFDPERFTMEEISKRGPFDYIPFSAGPRNCVGQKFAMLELKSLLAAFLKEFKFSKPRDFDVMFVGEGVLKSRNGLKLVIEPRNPSRKMKL